MKYEKIFLSCMVQKVNKKILVSSDNGIDK